MMSDAMDVGLCRSAVKDMGGGLHWPAMLDMDMGLRNYSCMNRMQYNHEGGKIEVYREDQGTSQGHLPWLWNFSLFVVG